MFGVSTLGIRSQRAAVAIRSHWTAIAVEGRSFSCLILSNGAVPHNQPGKPAAAAHGTRPIYTHTHPYSNSRLPVAACSCQDAPAAAPAGW